MYGTLRKPFKNITIRDTLFGDLPLDNWAIADSSENPWNLFKEVKKAIDKRNNAAAVEILKEIIAMPGLESRHYLQACYFLNELDAGPEEELNIYGAVVEVAMDGGVDMLAVYADHSARYYHVSGGAIIWDTPDEVISEKIDYILELGMDIVEQIGPWKADRPAAPVNTNARINFLTSKGLHFGEADQRLLFKDPMAGKIMYAMLDMMETLIDKTK